MYARVDYCSAHREITHEIHDFIAFFAFFQHHLISLLGSESKAIGALCEAHIGIVLTEQDAILGTRGEHSVWFIDTLSHQIID